MIIGEVGDLHFPFCHPMYEQFCQDTFEEYRVDWIHFVGDIADHHAISFWEHSAVGMSAGQEMDATISDIEHWQTVFPKASVCIGNHDERHYRIARKYGLPDNYLKSYAEVWNTPKWDWKFSHTFDDVLHKHGTGSSGKNAAYNLAVQSRCSCVIGHIHSGGSVAWHSNPYNLVFGLNAGCGIDPTAYAFAYGTDYVVRPVLGCGIVIDGEHAFFEVMRCGPGEKYHRSRAGRKRRLRKFIKLCKGAK